MPTTIDAHAGRNEYLFELTRAQELGLPPEIVEFLRRHEHPWLLLGKELTAFVESLVARVPAERRLGGNISPRAFLESEANIVVCEGATVEAGAYLVGPTFVAPGAVVRHGAYVRGSVYVGPKAVVGHTTEIKGSLLLPDAKAAHFAYVGDSILGAHCNLGAGTKLANLRFDEGEVKVRLATGVVGTGLKKFGAILGNRAQTGCNSVTLPGAILLPGAALLPNATGRGVVGKR